MIGRKKLNKETSYDRIKKDLINNLEKRGAYGISRNI